MLIEVHLSSSFMDIFETCLAYSIRVSKGLCMFAVKFCCNFAETHSLFVDNKDINI